MYSVMQSGDDGFQAIVGYERKRKKEKLILFPNGNIKTFTFFHLTDLVLKVDGQITVTAVAVFPW